MPVFDKKDENREKESLSAFLRQAFNKANMIDTISPIRLGK